MLPLIHSLPSRMDLERAQADAARLAAQVHELTQRLAYVTGQAIAYRDQAAAMARLSSGTRLE
jgi:hypothetical protein